MPEVTPRPASADVVVVGAGQAGLAVAAHLVRAGLVPVTDPEAGATGSAPTFVVLDAAPGPGGAWRERWPGLTMSTVNGVYELPGRALPVFDPAEPAAEALPRYFDDYERELGLAVRRPVRVRRVRDLGGPDRLLAVETVEEVEDVDRTVPTQRDGAAQAPGAASATAAGAGSADRTRRRDLRAGPPTQRGIPAEGGASVHVRSVGGGLPADDVVPTDDGLGGGAGPVRSVAGPVRPVSSAPTGAAVRATAAPTAGSPLPAAQGESAAPAGPVARTWHARAVVNATGTWTKPFWPTYPGAADFAGTQLHTHDFRRPEDLAGRRVLVVGGGISAVQHLLAIAPSAASTTWVTRRPPDWRDAAFSPELGRDAVARVDERTRAGLPPQSIVEATGLPMTDAYRAGIEAGALLARPPFARLVPDGAVWDAASASRPPADGWVTGPEHVAADVVLWATGFRAALDHLRPLGLRDAGGGIVMDGTRVVADPRVQLVGYGPSASTVGANRAGRAAVRQLRRLLGV